MNRQQSTVIVTALWILCVVFVIVFLFLASDRYAEGEYILASVIAAVASGTAAQYIRVGRKAKDSEK